MKRKNLADQIFGKLLVIKYSHTDQRYEAFWECQCDCGKMTQVSSGHLMSGHTQSCGCWRKERMKRKSFGNTWGRKYKDPWMFSAKTVWKNSYQDGCSFEKFLELSQLPCYYCGILPSNNFNKYLNKNGNLTNSKVSLNWAKKGNFNYNGLDRIDSNLNHSEPNCVPCCIICNVAKHDMSLQEFKNWIDRTYHHLKQKELS